MSGEDIAGALAGGGGEAVGGAAGGGGPTEMIQDGVELGTGLIDVQQKGQECQMEEAAIGAGVAGTAVGVAVGAALMAYGVGIPAAVALGALAAAPAAVGGGVVGSAHGALETTNDQVEYLTSEENLAKTAGLAASAATGDASGQTHSAVKGGVKAAQGMNDGDGAAKAEGDVIVQESRSSGVEPKSSGMDMSQLSELAPSSGGVGKSQGVEMGMAA